MKFRRMCAFFLVLILLLPVSVPAEEAGMTVTDEEINGFFGGVLFIGDSITRQLYTYIREIRNKDEDYMKGARFSTAQSYSLFVGSRKFLTQNPAQLTVNGEATPLWKVVGHYKPEYAFILLGVNDYIGEKIDKGVSYVERITELCAESSPDTKLVFISLTPVTRRFCRKKDYRTLWDQYNAAMEKKCAELGVYYMDLATPLKDEEGYLPEKYSSDNNYHLNSDGLDIWLRLLHDFARERILEKRTEN